MQTFNHIMATVFVALVAGILFLTAASFTGVGPARDGTLLAADCGPRAPVAETTYAGMRPPSC